MDRFCDLRVPGATPASAAGGRMQRAGVGAAVEQRAALQACACSGTARGQANALRLRDIGSSPVLCNHNALAH